MNKINVAYYSTLNDQAIWEPLLKKEMPELEIIPLAEISDPSAIDFALVWNPPAGELSKLPNIKAILNMGAGIDSLLSDRTLNTNVPIVRLVDERLTQRMKEYTILHVLRYHRLVPTYEDMQRSKQWGELKTPVAQERSVGVMGLGSIGRECALALKAVGFNVKGWSRTKNNIGGIECFAGKKELNEFVDGLDIIVSILPLTDKTKGLINRELISAMKEGVYFINIGRGGVQVESEIIEALNNGRIAGATLDVFEVEPLPKESPLWSHSAVTVTPHVASITDEVSSASKIASNIKKILNGGIPSHLVDINKGY